MVSNHFVVCFNHLKRFNFIANRNVDIGAIHNCHFSRLHQHTGITRFARKVLFVLLDVSGYDICAIVLGSTKWLELCGSVALQINRNAYLFFISFGCSLAQCHQFRFLVELSVRIHKGAWFCTTQFHWNLRFFFFIDPKSKQTSSTNGNDFSSMAYMRSAYLHYLLPSVIFSITLHHFHMIYSRALVLKPAS